MYAAVLFDLDGTLLDTLADLGNAVNRTLEAHGLPTHPLDAYRNFVGDGVYKLIERALPADRRDPQTFESCLQTYRKDYARNWNVQTRPYPGIAELLDELIARRIRLAVLSNKPDEFTQVCVRQLLGRWRFDVVLGARDDIPPKPDPASALEIARRLELSPGQFIYLGDSGVDMQTARAAGMTCVGALWGFRTREELQAAGAQKLIRHPLELLELLRGFEDRGSKHADRLG